MLRRSLLKASALLAAPSAFAQTKTIRIVVPYPAGGPLDVMARAVAERMKSLGNVIVENRPGAGGNIGAELVSRAQPDGTTLLMGAVATHAINPWLYSRVGFDALKDFTPLALVSKIPNVLVLNAATAKRLKIETLQDFIAYARVNPGRLNYGSGGNGSAGHLAAELFKTQGKLSMVHIPYTGGPAAQLALVAGDVDVNFDNIAAASTNIRSGKLKALAVTSAAKSSALPELPTIASVLPGFDIATWFGLFAPAKLPADMAASYIEVIKTTLASAEVKQRMDALMAEPVNLTGDAFAAFVRSENAKYEQIVKRTGAKVD
jgi:tripartite-type tricarboxylate transporter receptor subunit TctC